MGASLGEKIKLAHSRRYDFVNLAVGDIEGLQEACRA
jgi:hypothetical protein